jgi:hypothetical protein
MPQSSGERKTYPRSACDIVGGIVCFGRMLDETRLYAAGKLPPDYHPNLAQGVDGRCCRFTRAALSTCGRAKR